MMLGIPRLDGDLLWMSAAAYKFDNATKVEYKVAAVSVPPAESCHATTYLEDFSLTQVVGPAIHSS